MFTLIVTTFILGGNGTPADPARVLSMNHTAIGGFEKIEFCNSAASKLQGNYLNSQRTAFCVQQK